MKGESRVEAIVYTSNTGSTAQYAEMLAKETGLAAYSLDEARGKVPADSEVIYLGWVMAGTVKGYAAAAKRYIVRAVCAVGMAQPGAQGKILRERNKLPESVPLFQLQGNFDVKKLHGMYRLMMEVMVKTAGKALASKSGRTAEEDDMLDMMTNGGERVRVENLHAVLAWYKGEDDEMIPAWKIYPSSQRRSTVYLKNVVKNPFIEVGDYTVYDDFVNDPRDFERNNVLYHYPECNHDRLRIGRFCSIACGVKFIFNAANHAMDSLSTYTFPLFFEEWDLPTDTASIAETWDRRGDIVVGNDVWIGYEAIILAGVTIGDGAIIGSRAVVTKDVPPYTIVGGLPAKPIRKRFDEETIARLETLRWWDWDREKIKRSIDAIRRGDIDTLEKNA